MNIAGLAIDWAEKIAGAVDDPTSRPAGFAEPHYPVSEVVSVSRDNGFYVYHLPDDQLGQGSSFGNAKAWAETKGSGDMLNLFSIDAGKRVAGGMSVAYLLPFSDLSTYGLPASPRTDPEHDSFARAMPSAPGAIHLHPAYQQREFVIGDGLHVLETFFLPRTGDDDPAAAHEVVSLKNRTPHPLGITVVASVSLRGETERDLVCEFDRGRGALVAYNASRPDWVRVFGSEARPKGYWATTDEEEAYSPGQPLPDLAEETGDLTAVLQFDLLLLPGQRHNLPITLAFSSQGREDALRAYDLVRHDGHLLKDTLRHYTSVLRAAVLETPDALLTQGVQWAKACLLRPVSRYAAGRGVTNDPGRSSHFVGRDTFWYVHGCDFILSDVACGMLRVFAERQRDDGLIPEYIDGNMGETEDHGFNINDNTPLFVMAAAHHARATGHEGCLKDLYLPARRAGELILGQRDERGLVRCTNAGIGVKAICGWRNVLFNEEITGVVTEVNAECYAALRSLGDLAEMLGMENDTARYLDAAEDLKAAINAHLINPKNGLYVRNIDLEGRVFTQATVDLVFPLLCGVAEERTAQIVGARLSAPDFMTDAGIRVLPEENPRYDPSGESGCLGGVWPGATWWYAMSSARQNPEIMADCLRRSYWHYVANPKTFNTVPGQFSEWSDGQTLVNRGMRLSPWEAPRFLWAAVEGLAGLHMGSDGVSLDPLLPEDWNWLRLCNLLYRGGTLSFFLTRQQDEFYVYTCNKFKGSHIEERYEEELIEGAQTITTGVSITAFRRQGEILICLGSSLESPALGPFLTHRALKMGQPYRVHRLNSLDNEWQEIGVTHGSELQRITVRIEPQGYALYRFLEAE